MTNPLVDHIISITGLHLGEPMTSPVLQVGQTCIHAHTIKIPWSNFQSPEINELIKDTFKGTHFHFYKYENGFLRYGLSRQ